MNHKKEFYYYIDNKEVIMGRRGGRELRMERNAFMQTMLRRRLDIYSGSPDYEKIFSILVEEEQCIEFEEVKDEQKLLQ